MSVNAEQIKVLCRSLGADLVGISPIERFAKARAQAASGPEINFPYIV